MLLIPTGWIEVVRPLCRLDEKHATTFVEAVAHLFDIVGDEGERVLCFRIPFFTLEFDLSGGDHQRTTAHFGGGTAIKSAREIELHQKHSTSAFCQLPFKDRLGLAVELRIHLALVAIEIRRCQRFGNYRIAWVGLVDFFKLGCGAIKLAVFE